MMALICGFTLPAFAARTPATDTSYEQDYSYAAHGALFGSREVYSSSTWRFAQWTDMMQRTEAAYKASTHTCTSRADTNCTPAEWQSLINGLKGLDLRAQITRVNDAMNSHPYVATAQNWHRSMYWESPFEFLSYGGQCQDYAIAKYELLRAAGVPADLMRMVVLRDTAIGVDHAVLAVYVDGQPMLLDNLRRDIVPASSVSSYRPYYSINENGWWTHFGGQAMTQVAANYR
jgi:predicted transglutaminase-like cysteine proteinase